MNDKKLILTIGTGMALLVGWQTLTRGIDPIPQLAGIGAATLMLTFGAEVAPKLASGFAVLLAIAYALNYPFGGTNEPG